LRFDDNRDLLLDAAPGDQTPSTRVHFFADGRPAGVEITRQFDVYRVGGRSVRIVNGCPLAPQLVFGHRNVFPTGPLRGEIRAIDTAPPNDITVATGPCDISHFERVEKGSVVIFGEDGSIIRSFQTWAFGKVSVAGLRQ